ncbi:MAG: ribonuclease Y [Clostridia bacterium]|nr:ribonuclease Y [Clostridia bacterium]MDD4387363.1 ribonuclease Y [Clostridia bacterium]
MEYIIIGILTAIFSGVAFFYIGVVYRKKTAEVKIESAESEASRIIEDSRKDSERIKREAIIQAKDEMLKQKDEIEKEAKERKRELQDTENRINQRQDLVDKRATLMEEKENNIVKKNAELAKKEEELDKTKQREIEALSTISKMSESDAKKALMKELENDMTHEMAEYVKSEMEKAKYEVDKKAKDLLVQTIQRCAADHTSEATVTTVALPNDDLKGRIIGREGRNIRTIETLTGIDLIIDDTPDVIVLSSFDPIRREVARIAIERLIADGRVHPGKIEDMIEKAKIEVENTIKEEGERALYETGVINIHPELIKLLGKLRFRTSFGQNVLNHSIEVSHIAGLLASELGIDPTIAKRAGLLHDIGKSRDHDVEGTHVSLGIEILNKFKENDNVIQGMEAHHGDVEPKTMEAILVQAADAVSASRPGARRETVDTYIKRLKKLEEICNSYNGVEKSFAIQAGREIRLIVKPEIINDDNMIIMAKKVAKQIENEMTYPGQIKVSLIREMRVTELAK